MRLLGYTEAALFMAEHESHGEALRAWLYEIQYRDWNSAKALMADFRSVDFTPPLMSFRFGTPPVLVETIVDFRNRIVLLTRIQAAEELVVQIN